MTEGLARPVATASEPAPDEVRRLLRLLPEWFGIEKSLLAYVDDARTMPTFVAKLDGATVGVALVRLHFPGAAELHLIAVDPSQHHCGVGTALLTAVESDLRSRGVRWLQVKTLGASKPHAGYAATRQFYLARGFEPLEESSAIWGSVNPCLIMVKSIALAG